MSNTRIWDALSKTDPKHTKPFKRAGGFQGTAIKPIWMTKRMTEMFGPAGTGWGMDKPQFEVVNAGEEILVFCTVGLWYNDDYGRFVYGVGGDKVLGKNKYGPFTNDEAFKAAYTDALSNAMKQIGLGADIHMGLFDDEKYVRETAREYANGNTPPSNGNGHAEDEDVEALAPKDAPRDGNGKLLSTYKADRLKKAIAEEWRVTNTTPKGKKDQIYDYLDMARNPDDVALILNNNDQEIANSGEKAKIEKAADDLLRWFEKQSAPSLQ